ncbi:hypothetical protein AtubIFM55763_006924 [Aspergillus tubingensis]|nr:hypothetical protein AtubIFM55763_006924 [Aspergillus tubingensis]GLA92485.1 hypothetical protein AtubIFM57143_008012 [Aspergillus tubingensis]GLB17269.1 hypothetical protein AtubIFM61612_007131 [Aspergillus tubingensis]
MAAHVDWHAALSEREIPSIQNPAFSRFCHARGTPATRLTDWTALDGRDGVSSSVVQSYPVTQLQAEREEAATGFFDSDVEPTVLPLGNKNGKSTDNVPVSSDNLRPSMPQRESGMARYLPFLTPMAGCQRA